MGLAVTYGDLSFELKLAPDEVAASLESFKLPKKQKDALRKFKSENLCRALLNSVAYLLRDRCSEGVGKGGWGNSESFYMTNLYGKEYAGEHSPDSISATWAVTDALYAYHRIASLPSWDSIENELKEYMLARWNEEDGSGGNFKRSREGELRLAPSYRHSAMFLRQWLLLPGMFSHSEKTMGYLAKHFNGRHLHSKEEKVATFISAHSAFTSIKNDSRFKALLSQYDQLDYYLHSLEDVIVSKYIPEVCGWTPEIPSDRFRGRQEYTLFLLAELAYKHTDKPCRLTDLMNEALIATMDGPWVVHDNGGVSLFPHGPADISMSALAFSALFRKPAKTAKEQTFLAGLCSYLLNCLCVTHPESLHGIYSWALSYFVKDVAQSIAARSGT